MPSTIKTKNPTPEIAAHRTGTHADADNNAPALSALEDTSAHEPPLKQMTEPARTQSKVPTWLLELAHQLRNFRQWRLIIKPDQTLDLEYLAMLALQAQRKARAAATSPTPQLNLFTTNPLIDNSEACINNNNRQSIPEATPTNLNLAVNRTTEQSGGPTTMVAPFTVIDGNNQQALPKIIVLPEDLLTIKSHEQLHDFLSRVASAAMEAAIYACGSQEAAFIRLGSKAPQEYSSLPSPWSRPALVLAPARKLTAIRTISRSDHSDS
jgi:hypothetical protein